MNSINLSAVINQCEFDFDKVSSIHYESEQKPYDTAIITFTDTQLRARVTDDVENHVFSVFYLLAGGTRRSDLHGRMHGIL